MSVREKFVWKWQFFPIATAHTHTHTHTHTKQDCKPFISCTTTQLRIVYEFFFPQYHVWDSVFAPRKIEILTVLGNRNSTGFRVLLVRIKITWVVLSSYSFSSAKAQKNESYSEKKGRKKNDEVIDVTSEIELKHAFSLRETISRHSNCLPVSVCLDCRYLNNLSECSFQSQIFCLEYKCNLPPSLTHSKHTLSVSYKHSLTHSQHTHSVSYTHTLSPSVFVNVRVSVCACVIVFDAVSDIFQNVETLLICDDID